MSDKNFEIIRQIASKLGVSSSESNDDIYNPLYLSSISRSIDRLFSQLQAAQARIKELEQAKSLLTFKFTDNELPENESDSVLFILNDGNDWLGYYDLEFESFVCPEWGERHHKSQVKLWISVSNLKSLPPQPKESE